MVFNVLTSGLDALRKVVFEWVTDLSRTDQDDGFSPKQARAREYDVSQVYCAISGELADSPHPFSVPYTVLVLG